MASVPNAGLVQWSGRSGRYRVHDSLTKSRPTAIAPYGWAEYLSAAWNWHGVFPSEIAS